MASLPYWHDTEAACTKQAASGWIISSGFLTTRIKEKHSPSEVMSLGRTARGKKRNMAQGKPMVIEYKKHPILENSTSYGYT
jgi:hypothetical protein